MKKGGCNGKGICSEKTTGSRERSSRARVCLCTSSKHGRFHTRADIWYGKNPFSGREIVYDIDLSRSSHNIFRPATVMSYDCAAVGGKKQIERFLVFQQEMLQLVSPQRPFRGPASRKKGGDQYQCDFRILPVPSLNRPQRIIGSENITVITGDAEKHRARLDLNFIFCALR